MTHITHILKNHEIPFKFAKGSNPNCFENNLVINKSFLQKVEGLLKEFKITDWRVSLAKKKNYFFLVSKENDKRKRLREAVSGIINIDFENDLVGLIKKS